ncbi:MAG TPA: VWA domain-containing protein, partial [Thermoanaerobaculia bacterium]|nr:VWA domain-containing protein [Thermoanaerobaculia bacterium]
MKRVLVPVISLSCALALGFGSVLAQQKTPPRPQEEPVFGASVDVRVVNVEVVVTDKDGNRVRGLKPGDFRLKVDGKQVPVDYFSEVFGGQSVAPPAAAGGTAPAAVAVPGAEPGGVVGTSYLVFIDDYFPIENQRNEVLKALKNDLSRLGPEDRMAIVAYDGGRLALVSNWSQSQAELAQAFDRAMARHTRGLDRVVELKRFAGNQALASSTVSTSAPNFPDPTGGSPVDLNARMDNTGLTPLETDYGKMLFRQEEGVIKAAARTLRTFASPPGRKVLLLLDGGWPYSIQSYIRGDAPIAASREFKDGETLMRVLTSTANLLGYTVYPIDVPGTSGAANDASVPGAAGTAAASFRDQEIKGTLEFVAMETGGKELRNGNRMVALAEVAADTRSYYWLGFSPTWEHNDVRHKVDVTVDKPGLKVRSRDSFLDLSKKSEVTMMVESALLFGNVPGGAVLPMRVGTPAKTRNGTEIPITLGLPSDVVTLVQMGNKYAAHAELRFAASDKNGNDSELPVVPLNITADHPARPGAFIKFETKLTLKGDANHLVAAVYDPVSGKVATAETDLALP